MRYGSFFIVVAYGCPKTLFPPTKSPFPLCQKSALCVWPISVLLPWLVSLSHVHCPYYYVFVVSLRIRWCLPPALVFVLHPLHFCMNFRIHLPFSTKSMLGFWLEYLESTDWLGKNWHLYDCAGSVSTAGLGLPSLERPTAKLMSGNLDFGRLPIIPRTEESGPLCFSCLKTCFPSESLEFWCVLGRGCLYGPAPVKTLGTGFWSVSGCGPLREGLSSPWRRAQGESPGSLLLVSSWRCSICLSLCWFCFISCGVINHSCDHGDRLSESWWDRQTWWCS